MTAQIQAHIRIFGIPWNRLQVIRLTGVTIIHAFGFHGWMGAVRAATEEEAWALLQAKIPLSNMDQFTEILVKVADSTARHHTFLLAEESNRRKEIAEILMQMRLCFIRPYTIRTMKELMDMLMGRMSVLMPDTQREELRAAFYRAADALPSMHDRDTVAARAEAMLYLLETIFRS
jgi:hypothetical protein